MKVLKVLAVAAAVSTSGYALADSEVVQNGYDFEAKQLLPTGVRAEIGTTGYGGALLWTANPYVGLALGYNGGEISWTDDVSVNGTKYDLDMDNKLAYLNAEVRPWGASENPWIQGLYVAAGVGYVDNQYDLKKRIRNGGTLDIDGNKYQLAAANQEGGVRGKLAYDNEIAPYVGFGWAPKISKNFGIFGEIGAYYTGNPDVQLSQYNLSPVAGNNVSAQQAVNKEANEIRNDDKFEWLPVGKVGLSFHW
ncbi:ornithine uptake porin CarO [Acinetobacter shaoyimingii]|uniref:Autotransporter outer membrane beta-barrel domain-containing protein n=1 Tax=Acinetobacter shaoyimingii TaxID=2715164 RepID=A0A6G8RUK3_9GAMM|nr:ornithine uptake porin CarO [Acinetobacter shaoyimingii]NHB58212.1 autotransporter outer membrane beta-barrel domain-containing protein [Acinetobacter shaoyimingii]QIO05557.1 autotransporter outer membrane beta-barrel domain-containing protein [Acinetobacter shaoyimingii]